MYFILNLNSLILLTLELIFMERIYLFGYKFILMCFKLKIQISQHTLQLFCFLETIVADGNQVQRSQFSMSLITKCLG